MEYIYFFPFLSTFFFTYYKDIILCNYNFCYVTFTYLLVQLYCLTIIHFLLFFGGGDFTYNTFIFFFCLKKLFNHNRKKNHLRRIYSNLSNSYNAVI